MATWWLAIDRRYTSYDELKHRKVIAQGWPELGDLRTLLPLVEANDKQTFIQTVNALDRIKNGRITNGPKIMWLLLSMRAGDLVVGIEGTTLKGICELNVNGWDSYCYQSPDVYNYAQTIGFPTEWVDWDPGMFGFTPTPPNRSVPGISGLKNESQNVMDAWRNYQNSRQTF